MNIQFSEFTKRPARSVTLKLGLFALLAALLPVIFAQDSPDRSPGRVEVTGNFDWSIVPANLIPPFVLVGTDGEFYVRHLPLVGKITLTGRSVSIEGKISADFNGELDATFTGPVWAAVTITGTVDGKKVLLFEGNATGDTVALVSTGKITLNGRGPYEGSKLEMEFTENGPGNTDTYSFTGALIPAPAH
ncbi:MAG TPA: hypothetical protein VFZ59_23845 [Verrucomicrobiae bacterium]|nr:hypothetical protein [Verrucomicrobiae bacterium]